MEISLETVLRLVTIGADLLMIALLLANRVRRPLRIALVGMLFGSICYLLTSSPSFGLERTLRVALDLFSILTPFWTWLVARSLFEREPHSGVTAAIVMLLVASWFSTYFLDWTGRLGFLTIHMIGLALLGDLARIAWSGRDDDLVERRRMIRLWLPLLVALQAGGILVSELVFGTDRIVPAIHLFNSLAILTLTVFAGIILLQTDPELVIETQTTRPDGPAPSSEGFSPAEVVLKEKLEAAMADGVYRQSGLTIAALANHLDVPEHRLRALINRRLGYRNFAAFLNRYRIGEAREILADRERVTLQVLIIAMDLGYNSLPSFNRAFREITSMTPTEYRRAAIGRN